LTKPHLEEPFLAQFVDAARGAANRRPGQPLYLVGHSFGSRAAVHLWAREDFRRQLPKTCRGIIAFGYPLVHPTQRRERKLLELPRAARVLFISGDRDDFAGDFRLLEKTLSRAACGGNCAVAKIAGGDHSIQCPKACEGEAVAKIRAAVAGFVGGGGRGGGGVGRPSGGRS